MCASPARKVVDIIHPGVSNVSKSELGEMIAKVSQCLHMLAYLSPVRVCTHMGRWECARVVTLMIKENMSYVAVAPLAVLCPLFTCGVRLSLDWSRS